MFTSESIHPVSEFSRKPAEYIKRLKETGKPELLTVNGKAELVIQDAKAYEEMVDLLRTLERIALAAQAHDEGHALPAQDAFAALNKRLAARYPDAHL